MTDTGISHCLVGYLVERCARCGYACDRQERGISSSRSFSASLNRTSSLFHQFKYFLLALLILMKCRSLVSTGARILATHHLESDATDSCHLHPPSLAEKVKMTTILTADDPLSRPDIPSCYARHASCSTSEPTTECEGVSDERGGQADTDTDAAACRVDVDENIDIVGIVESQEFAVSSAWIESSVPGCRCKVLLSGRGETPAADDCASHVTRDEWSRRERLGADEGTGEGGRRGG